MIDELTAFRLWNVANLHFTTDKFDLTKTKSIRGLSDRYKKLSPQQRQVFQYMAKNFPSERELCKALVACYLAGLNPRFESYSVAKFHYDLYNNRAASLTYKIDTDISAMEYQEMDIHALLNQYEEGKILPETMVILDAEYPFLDRIYDDPNYEFLSYKKTILALRKYRLIFKAEKYRDRVKDLDFLDFLKEVA